MLLYILRHAEAEVVITSDKERKLTPHGKEQATRMGNFCLEHELLPLVVLTSPFDRTKETAEQVVAILKNTQLIEVPWMASGMSPETALHELKAYAAFETLMIVGHEPDLSSFIAMLLGINNPQTLDVSKASLTAIELSNVAAGAGVLEFFIPCELAGKN